MARIRTIKPEFWTDEKIVELSPLARLLFIGMWNFVDDEGRAPLSLGRLKMQILPSDSADISGLFGEIRGASLIVVYEVDGKQFFQVQGFSKHQKIDRRVPSKHPAPPISPDPPRVPPKDQGREGIKEGNAAPLARDENPEAELFDRGKKILGKSSGGLINQLLTAKNKNVMLARLALETAATKQDPREYIGAIIRGRDSPEDARQRGDAW